MDVKLAIDFNGNANEVIEYYKKSFGMKLVFIMRAKEAPKSERDNLKMDDEQILYSLLKFENMGLIIADMPKGQAVKKTQQTAPSSTIAVEPDSAEHVDSMHDLLVKDGGTSIMPPADAFWDARFAMAIDKFGVSWMFNYQKTNS